MCCKPKMHQNNHKEHCHHEQNSCCCTSPKEERLEKLEKRLSDLQEEAKTIESRIEHIKNCDK